MDELFSGRWWYRWARLVSGRKLERLLETHSEKSFQVRRATENYRRWHFGVRFLRAVPRSVMLVVEQSERAGVPTTDLQLMVLNRDISLKNGAVRVRRLQIVRALSAAFATIAIVHFALMCLMSSVAPAPTWLKALVIAGVFCVYAVLYRGWSLYAYRAIAAIERSGEAVEAISGSVLESATVAIHDRLNNPPHRASD